MIHIKRIDEMHYEFLDNDTIPQKGFRYDYGKKRKRKLTDGCVVSLGNSEHTILGFGVYVDLEKHNEWLAENFPSFTHLAQEMITKSKSKCGIIHIPEKGLMYEYEFIPIEYYDDELYYNGGNNCIPYIYKKTIDIEKTPITQLSYEKLENLIAGVDIISSMFEQ